MSKIGMITTSLMTSHMSISPAKSVVALDAGDLLAGDVGVRQVHQPFGGLGVPGQWVALDHAAALGEPARRGEQPLGVRTPPLGLELTPVERQRGEIEQAGPQVGQVLGLGGLLRPGRPFAARERQEVEADAAEQELVIALCDRHLSTGERRTVLRDRDGDLRGAVLPDQRVGGETDVVGVRRHRGGLQECSDGGDALRERGRSGERFRARYR
ncbi:hypothetical protein [Sphaerimonospora mesophila]|uniref:hypothetical protein n=1 Tax=Sphaerimonospora mesophila TaxID=37483 RepID=UPI001F358BB1